MVKIYGIFDGDLCVYVGKTKRQDLNLRLKEHLVDKNYKEKASYFLDNMCTIQLLSQVRDFEAAKEEQYYIDKYFPAFDLVYTCFNRIRAKKMSKIDTQALSRILMRNMKKGKQDQRGMFEVDSGDDLDDFLNN